MCTRFLNKLTLIIFTQILIIFAFNFCNDSSSVNNIDLNKKLDYSKLIKYLNENTNYVEIHLNGDKKRITITLKFIDSENINKIIKFITEKSEEFYKCDYNGKIYFKNIKKNVNLLECDFNSDCGHIVFIYDKGFYSKRISEAGRKFLKKSIEQYIIKNKY